MCGICGVLSLGPGPLPPESHATVRSMCQAIVHRGPDDEGYYNDEKVALGMRRLSIIDLATGHQPISNEDRTVWTVYNGEIFNFPELRQELEARGHQFTTRADTEVIVHLYEEAGEDFAHKLNGMFAIALWDTKLKRLILVRDRLGVKPLHTLEWNGRLYFASEIKALLRTGFPREMDYGALSQFFTFEYIPAPRTIFKGIQKLLPGHLAVVQDGRVEIRKYWDVRYAAEAGTGTARSEESWADEIYERLKASVRRRLISDVPLGVFLSGGIDSSAVTALMAETSSGPVKSFSIGFKEKSFDELPWARVVAERFGTEHTEFVVDPEQVRELVPVLARSLDEPLADASCIPTYIISKLARRYVTVALAGDGGDELFAGYDTHKAFRLAHLYHRVPAFLRRGLIRPVVRCLPASKKRLSFEFKAKKFISGVEHRPEIANIIWWGAYAPEDKAKLFSADLRAALTRENLFGPVETWQATAPPGDSLDRICYLDLKLYLQDDLLVKVDRMSMANSLEIRAPFLDYTFVEFAATIPASLKLRVSTSKYILKKMLRRLLPEEILTKKKIGFDIPLGDWLQRELKDFTLDMLSPANLKRHGLFDPAYVGRLLQEHLRGRHNHRQLLWPLIVFQSWRDAYLS